MNAFDIQECTEKELDLVGGGALFEFKVPGIIDIAGVNNALLSVDLLNLLSVNVLNNAVVDVGPGIVTVPYPSS